MTRLLEAGSAKDSQACSWEGAREERKIAQEVYSNCGFPDLFVIFNIFSNDTSNSNAEGADLRGRGGGRSGV
jgi:hypothetical protein